MTYKETVSRLMSMGEEINALPGLGMTDEMITLREGILPHLDARYEHTVHLNACATIFRCACKHAVRIGHIEMHDLWTLLEMTYIKKNHDYGDSWSKELDMFGIICQWIRMYEKINRIIAVTREGAMVNDESVYDTLTDIANYCVMTAMWISNQ